MPIVPDSDLAAVSAGIADLLAKCESFWDLSGDSNEAEAATHIFLPWIDPRTAGANAAANAGWALVTEVEDAESDLLLGDFGPATAEVQLHIPMPAATDERDGYHLATNHAGKIKSELFAKSHSTDGAIFIRRVELVGPPQRTDTRREAVDYYLVELRVHVGLEG